MGTSYEGNTETEDLARFKGGCIRGQGYAYRQKEDKDNIFII